MLVDLQGIIKVVADALYEPTLAEYNARNNTAVKTLVEAHNVQLRQFPAEVMLALKQYKDALIKEQVKAGKYFPAYDKLYSEFLASMRAYNKLPLQTYDQNC